MTWQQVERVTKHFAALIWFTLELWQWGARPHVLAAILAVLGASEAARILVLTRGGTGLSIGSNESVSPQSRSEPSSHG